MRITNPWSVGDRVEVMGLDVDLNPISQSWVPGRVIANDMRTITVKLDNSNVPRTVLPTSNDCMVRAPAEKETQ